MSDIQKRALRAYREGGFSKVVGAGVRLVASKLVGDIPFYVWRNKRRIDRCIKKLEEANIGQRLSIERLKRHKSSDTVFVFGSGDSINQITEEQWKVINQHDSVGLNRWPMHPHIPTYHVFELPPGEEWSLWRRQYYDLLNEKREQYHSIPLVLKDTTDAYEDILTDDIPGWISDNVLLSPDSNFPEIGDDISKQRQLLTHLRKNGYFDPNRSTEYFYRKRGSISYLIHLCCVLGYDTIVLCGVDMVHSRYFFEDGKYRNEIAVEVDSLIPDGRDSETHWTADETFISETTLDDIIRLLDSVVLEYHDISLFVENSISKLHPDVPLYDYGGLTDGV